MYVASYSALTVKTRGRSGGVPSSLSSGPVCALSVRALYVPYQGREHVACWGWGWGGSGGRERVGYWGSRRAVSLVQAGVHSVSYMRELHRAGTERCRVWGPFKAPRPFCDAGVRGWRCLFI